MVVAIRRKVGYFEFFVGLSLQGLTMKVRTTGWSNMICKECFRSHWVRVLLHNCPSLRVPSLI